MAGVSTILLRVRRLIRDVSNRTVCPPVALYCKFRAKNSFLGILMLKKRDFFEKMTKKMKKSEIHDRFVRLHDNFVRLHDNFVRFMTMVVNGKL